MSTPPEQLLAGSGRVEGGNRWWWRDLERLVNGPLGVGESGSVLRASVRAGEGDQVHPAELGGELPPSGPRSGVRRRGPAAAPASTAARGADAPLEPVLDETQVQGGLQIPEGTFGLQHVEAGMPMNAADVEQAWWLMDVLRRAGVLVPAHRSSFGTYAAASP